jgi:fluoride exporter
VKHTLYQALLVALGSALGGLARWAIGLAAASLIGSRFPWGTLAINVSGCLFLGWFGTLLGERLWPSAETLRLLVIVGFTGAFTTFSTFEFETNSLLRNGDNLLAMSYLFASIALGLLAVRLGMILAHAHWRLS